MSTEPMEQTEYMERFQGIPYVYTISENAVSCMLLLGKGSTADGADNADEGRVRDLSAPSAKSAVKAWSIGLVAARPRKMFCGQRQLKQDS
jgi:hypothetical protein